MRLLSQPVFTVIVAFLSFDFAVGNPVFESVGTPEPDSGLTCDVNQWDDNKDKFACGGPNGDVEGSCITTLNCCWDGTTEPFCYAAYQEENPMTESTTVQSTAFKDTTTAIAEESTEGQSTAPTDTETTSSGEDSTTTQTTDSTPSSEDTTAPFPEETTTTADIETTSPGEDLTTTQTTDSTSSSKDTTTPSPEESTTHADLETTRPVEDSTTPQTTYSTSSSEDTTTPLPEESTELQSTAPADLETTSPGEFETTTANSPETTRFVTTEPLPETTSSVIQTTTPVSPTTESTTAAPQNQTTTPEPESESGLSTTAAVFISLGVLLFVSIAAGLTYWFGFKTENTVDSVPDDILSIHSIKSRPVENDKTSESHSRRVSTVDEF